MAEFLRPRHHIRKGLTFVELMASMAIAVTLVVLLLAALQATREAARRSSCVNNMRHLAEGCVRHEFLKNHFPTNGWGFAWTGEAERGSDRRQPAGWIYNILPYVGEASVHSMGAGLTGAARTAAQLDRVSARLPWINCPTRRKGLFPWAVPWTLVNAGRPSRPVARTDYAANGGDIHVSPSEPTRPSWLTAPPNIAAGPASLDEGDSSRAMDTFTAKNRVANGVIHVGSMTTASDVSDGLSRTLLLGEKYLDPLRYADGLDEGDGKTALIGDSMEITRWTTDPPLNDTRGRVQIMRFGGPHEDVVGIAMCDGGVHMVAVSVDSTVFKALGNREDGGPPGDFP